MIVVHVVRREGETQRERERRREGEREKGTKRARLSVKEHHFIVPLELLVCRVLHGYSLFISVFKILHNLC